VIAQSNTDLPPNTEARSVLVKIVDFGLARLQKSSPHETLELQNEKAFIGTPSYVSPEQARNVHDVDIRSDLYSLGCTMYFALAGRPPFVGESVFELLAQHLESEPEPLERRRPEIPPALASIVRRLMAKKPEKRFQTPAELIGELGFFFSNDRGANRPSAAFRMDVVARPLPESVPTPEPHPTHVVAPVTEIRPTDSYPANADGPVQELPGGPTAIIDFQSAVPREANGASVDADTQACSVGDPSTANGATAPEPHADATAMIDPAAESPVASFHSLLLDWRLWTSVVEALFRGRTPEMNEAIYRELHRRFLKECRTYAGRGAADQRVLVQNMADLVQPWLSLASFPTGDRATLTSLHAKCRQLNAAMGSRAPTQSHWLLAVVISVCGIALLGWFASQGFGSWIVDAVSRLLQ
jgi:hypothetical protein